MLDLCLHAGTKFALEQWLDARGLGESFQDTDPESPTFGDWFYRHDPSLGTFVWWNHPQGKLIQTAAVVDGDGNVTTPASYFNGFFGLLRVTGDSITHSVQDWVSNSTALVNQQGFPGYGGAGVTVISPGEILDYLDSNGLPGWELLGGNQWTDPRAWVQGPAMEGDERDFGGQTYRSLVDFNHWSPLLAPQTWELISEPEPDPPAEPEWAVGTTYAIGDIVTYQGARYECRQAHTAITGWFPPVVPALWLPL